MPDVYRAEFPNDANESQLDNGPDSDSSSDDDDADDVDENGDLADFVVADDDESDGDGQPYRSNTRPPASAGKGKSKKSRQKRKGKKAVKKMTIAQLKKESLRNAAAKKKYLNRLRKNFVSSAKIDKIMELLRSIRENNPVEKTIVFSQFTSFLDLVEVPLSDTNWKWVSGFHCRRRPRCFLLLGRACKRIFDQHELMATLGTLRWQHERQKSQ